MYRKILYLVGVDSTFNLYFDMKKQADLIGDLNLRPSTLWSEASATQPTSINWPASNLGQDINKLQQLQDSFGVKLFSP